MKRPRPVALAVVALALAAVAEGQNHAKPATPVPMPAPAATPVPLSASQRAAVADLFAALKLQQQVQSMPESMVDGEIARNQGMGPFRDLMVGWLKKYMTWSAMEPQLTQLYGSTFTEEELKTMAAFYRSPAGQKAVQKMPEMMQRTAMLGAQLAQSHTDELKQQMSARADEMQKKESGAGAGPAPKATAPPKKP